MKQKYVVPKLPSQKVVLYSTFGNIEEFRSYSHFINQITYSRYFHISDYNIYYVVDCYGITRRRFAWIAYWKYGKQINSSKISKDVEKEIKSRKKVVPNRYNLYMLGRQTYTYRCDSVPFIHIKHNHSYYRKPKTTQEKRLYFIALYEGINVRGGRKYKNLPCAHDDISHSFQKNWKKFRKHQWKEKIK